MVKRSYDCEEATGTFFVIIKLDPMATVPDTARARPTYLSSTMKKYVGGEGGWLGGWWPSGIREAWLDSCSCHCPSKWPGPDNKFSHAAHLI